VTVRAIFFDIGETILNESRVWCRWADWLGVSPLTFLAVLGSVIERNESHLQVFEVFRPGFDLEREEAAMAAAGTPNTFDASDVYADVLPTLSALKRDGYLLGVAGNQPARAERLIHDLGLPVDFVAVSETLRAIKPSLDFFRRLVEMAGFPAEEIAYVGDRIDNDVLPARAAGMLPIFLRRGPWGIIQGRRPEAAHARLVIDSLLQLPQALKDYAESPQTRN